MSITALLILILAAILWPGAMRMVIGIAFIILLNMAAQAIHDTEPAQVTSAAHTSAQDAIGPTFRPKP